jgi:hypothetical protein
VTADRRLFTLKGYGRDAPGAGWRPAGQLTQSACFEGEPESFRLLSRGTYRVNSPWEQHTKKVAIGAAMRTFWVLPRPILEGAEGSRPVTARHLVSAYLWMDLAAQQGSKLTTPSAPGYLS